MPRPTELANGLAYRVKINGRDLHDFGAVINSPANLDMMPLEIPTQSFPERHDTLTFRAAFRPRSFVLSGRIFADSAANLRTNLDALKVNVSGLRGNNFSLPEALRVEFSDQTDRYYPCQYVGSMTFQAVGSDPNNAQLFSFILPLMQIAPAIATTPTTAAPSGTGPSFTTLEQGSAPGPAIIELEGAATAPDFYITDCAFHCSFNWDSTATYIDGSTAPAALGAAVDSDLFEPGDYDGGRYDSQGEATAWASVINNPAAQSWIFVIRPQFAYTAAGNHYLLDYYIDANNGVRLYYNGTSDKWVFEKEHGGTTVILTADTAQTFSADDAMTIAISFDGSGGMEIYKDGESDGTNADTNAYTGASGTMYLGDQPAGSIADCKYDFIFGFPFKLSDDDIRRFCDNPLSVQPHSLKKSKTGNLSANERSIIDLENGAIDKLTTAMTKTNDLGDWDTNGFPVLRPNQVCFYVPSGESIGGVKVTWRKRYL